jgi:hypothetical protein
MKKSKKEVTGKKNQPEVSKIQTEYEHLFKKGVRAGFW